MTNHHLWIWGVFILLVAVAAATEPVAAVSTPAPRRTFANMPVRERLAIMDALGRPDATQLFQLFLDAGRIEKDSMKRSMLQGMLVGELMRHPPSQEFIEKMRSFVTDGSNDSLERGLIINAFQASRTKVGAEFVLWAATSPQADLRMRQAAMASVSELGGGGSHPHLPPLIEPLWRESDDADLLQVVALAMAGEGAPSSIVLLMQAAASPDGQDDVRRLAALKALLTVDSGNAVPALAEALNQSTLGSRAQIVAFKTLNQIAVQSAPQAIVTWLRAADSQAAQLATQWTRHARFQLHWEAVAVAMKPGVTFQSDEVREALRSGLATYKASRPEMSK